MKALKTEEGYILDLNRGNYLINGEVVSHQSSEKIVVKELDIRPITRNVVTDHYWNPTTNEKMSNEDYLEKIDELSKPYDEDAEEWTDLDSEFAYRRFENSWQRTNKNIEVIGDKISFEIIEGKLNTGNPYIKLSGLVYPNANFYDNIYTYNRIGATSQIVFDKFKSLGFEFKLDQDRRDTKNSKFWTNSKFSHLRYAAAFGQYIFSEEWSDNSIRNVPFTNLASAKRSYARDKKKLESIIDEAYRNHFKIEIFLTKLEEAKTLKEIRNLIKKEKESLLTS